jgi:hypothetical protein
MVDPQRRLVELTGVPVEVTAHQYGIQYPGDTSPQHRQPRDRGEGLAALVPHGPKRDLPARLGQTEVRMVLLSAGH